MSREANLRRLQDVDSESDKAQSRLAEIEAALGENEAVQQARAAAEHTEEQARKLGVQQRDLELEIQGLIAKIQRVEQQLYSGTVKNPKELADLQEEVASLKRRQQKLEDDLLEVMIQKEEAQAAQAEAQTQRDQTEAEWSTHQTDLTDEKQALQERLAELEEKRATLHAQLDAGDLAAYQSLRKRKGGLAVAEMRDKSCSACGVAISQGVAWQLRQDTLTFCSNCERILVRDQ